MYNRKHKGGTEKKASKKKQSGHETPGLKMSPTPALDSRTKFQPLGSLKSLACLWDKISDFWMRRSFESKLFNDLLDLVHNSGLNNDSCFEFHPTQTSEITFLFDESRTGLE